MYPQVVQFETRQLQFERELRFARERATTRASVGTDPGSTSAWSLRSRVLPRWIRWSYRSTGSQA